MSDVFINSIFFPLLPLLHKIMGYMDLYRSVEPHLQCTDHLFVNGRRALYATCPLRARSNERPSMLLLKEPLMLPLLPLLHKIMGYMDLHRSVEAHLQCTDHLFVNGRKTLTPLDPLGARSTERPSMLLLKDFSIASISILMDSNVQCVLI